MPLLVKLYSLTMILGTNVALRSLRKSITGVHKSSSFEVKLQLDGRFLSKFLLGWILIIRNFFLPKFSARNFPFYR